MLVAPGNLVQEFVQPFHCRKQRGPRCPFNRIAVKFADQESVRGIDMQVSAQGFPGLAVCAGGILLHTYMAEYALG